MVSMSDAEHRTNTLDEWWKVMQEACDTMTDYSVVMDRIDIPATDREKMKADLLAKATRLNQLAEQIATRNVPMAIMDGPAKTRRFQIKLANVFVATFWIAVSCGVATGMWRGQVEGPIWIFVAVFALLAAFWSIQGRYWGVASTIVYGTLFLLLLYWLDKRALLG